MKRSFIYSITVVLAAGLISSCTNKTESTTTTPEKYPAQKPYATATPKKRYEKPKKDYAKPTPPPKDYAKPTPTPKDYVKPTPTPKKSYDSPKPSPSPSPY